MQQFYKMQLW